MFFQIQDSAAVAFTRAFYVALLSGRTVQQSFDIAREALKAAPYVPDSVKEGEKFILLPEPKPHVEGEPPPPPLHDVPIFFGRPVDTWPGPGQCSLGPSSGGGGIGSGSGDSRQEHLPAPPPDFEGREVDMYRVITMLLNRRLVSLVGDEGVGKSALAAAVCTYIADRGMFGDGVVFLRAQNITTHETVSFLFFPFLFSFYRK